MDAYVIIKIWLTSRRNLSCDVLPGSIVSEEVYPQERKATRKLVNQDPLYLEGHLYSQAPSVGEKQDQVRSKYNCAGEQ